MGKKGKPGKMKKGPGGIFGGLAGAAGGLLGRPGVGMPGQSGTFRVDRFGNVTKISIKRRKKGYRMPRLLAELIRSNIEQNRSNSQAVVLSTIAGVRR
ncbi:MAG: hypothetical protein ACREAG_08805 [Nitrosopumilaceae archaeon]